VPSAVKRASAAGVKSTPRTFPQRDICCVEEQRPGLTSDHGAPRQGSLRLMRKLSD